MNFAGIPNLICLARIGMVVPIVWLLVQDEHGWTLLLFVAAAISDGLDGYLAKTYGWTSELGKVLDPLADKLLLVSVFITLALVGLVPAWLAAIVVARDLIIGFGAWTYKVLFGPLNGQPTPLSKLNTLLQLSFVILVVARAAFLPVPEPLMVALGAGVLVTTVVSGIDYTLIYVRRARVVSQQRRQAG